MTTASPPAHSPPSGRKTGLWSWITTVDHKRIGILYGVTAIVFFAIGGLEALLMRIQLAVPENTFIGAELYNQLFTMHGTTMIFLVAMPLSIALFNYIIPLQIGARDVAFPRLNALSYWIFLFGGIYLNVSFLWLAAPNAGWTGYSPLAGPEFSPGLNMDFWVIGLSILGVSSIMGGVNFLATIINLRAPGMRLMRMPVFTWMTLVTSFLLITALPVLGVALIYLLFDRFFGTSFFIPAGGGDPVLWQHLFWIFGHPEVYILILPAFGIVSEVVPVFSRKPLFGYAVVVFSGILIGFIGWGVWGHHMFATGMGAIADAFFGVATMIVAIPTGVKIFNWLATMWGGSIQFRIPMLYVFGLIATFTIGGISGVMHASPPADLQQHDTYFVVAHFHYVIFGGTLMGMLAGLYYWWPKMTGRLLDERLGLWNFWLIFIGFNMTFFPMHFIGLLGMPRRIFTYFADVNVAELNLIASVGAFIQALGVILLLYSMWRSRKHGAIASSNPWQAPTLEWAISSPPPEYNFARIPEVRSREPLWDRPGEIEKLEEEAPKEGIHLPNPSYWPIVVGAGVALTWILFMTNTWWAPLFGGAILLVGVANWALEPAG